jgi:hypothetical protein
LTALLQGIAKSKHVEGECDLGFALNGSYPTNQKLWANHPAILPPHCIFGSSCVLITGHGCQKLSSDLRGFIAASSGALQKKAGYIVEWDVSEDSGTSIIPTR